jgi:asparagine synthase (glutamine-hydrolysing)
MSSNLFLGQARLYGQTVAEAALADTWRRALVEFGPAGAAAQASGAFAVALVGDDGKAFLAVDRFAIHSLCYTVEGGRLRFAARADELVGSNPALAPQALFDYLYFHVVPSPRTVFAGVHRLPPGHCAVFENGRLTVAPYWVAAFEPASPRADFGALRDEFRSLLQGSVSTLLDGGKAGCFLSGGTDSSTVAGMLSQASGGRAATYSIGFEAEGYDEMAYARIAARHFATEHHEYYVTADDLVQAMPKVARHYDQPFGNSSAVPAYFCAAMAARDGVTRILAGDGGDELFGGNTRYAKQRVFGWYQHLPRAVRESVMEPLLERSPLGRLPGLRKGASYVQQARIPMPDRAQSYNLLLRLQPAEVLTPAFLAQIDTGGPLAHQQQTWHAARASSELDRTLAYDWRYTLAETDLPKVVGTTTLAGIGVGFPMLDQRLLDFSMRLPAGYKLRGLKLRWFFKEALRGFLPDPIISKPKQGFGLPFGVWVVRHPALRAQCAQALASLATRGVVEPRFIAALLDTHLNAHPHYYGEMVWILSMLEHWLQEHAPDFRLRD